MPNYINLKTRNTCNETKVQVRNSQLIDEKKIQYNNIILDLYNQKDTRTKTYYKSLSPRRTYDQIRLSQTNSVRYS